jgi:hypothetical protein
LSFPVPPTISKGPSKAVVGEGSNTEMNCEVSGAPTPTVTWLLNGDSVNNDSHIVQTGTHIIIYALILILDISFIVEFHLIYFSP